jgi:RimJ/RimL family protein N-acetyltransferase
MKKGNFVILRAIEKSDLPLLRTWRNEENFKKHFREYLEISDLAQQKWYEEDVNNNSRIIMFAIVDSNNSQLVGCCGLTYINWVHRNADFSFYMGKDLSYIDDEGYALEAAQLLIDFGFNQIGLKRIWTEIYEFDFLKDKFLNEIGFQLDGRLRSNYFYDGKWWDSLIYSLLSD